MWMDELKLADGAGHFHGLIRIVNAGERVVRNGCTGPDCGQQQRGGPSAAFVFGYRQQDAHVLHSCRTATAVIWSKVASLPVAIQESIMHTPDAKPVRSLTSGFRVAAMALLAASAVQVSQHAVAHHGWAWAEDQQSTLNGKIQSISMSAPHPTLQIIDAAGGMWQIDLGNPSQTERSGFTANSGKAGDAITVLGNRNRDQERKHMKAVRITIGDKQFHLYPERITAK
jgi:hypothetical protein